MTRRLLQIVPHGVAPADGVGAFAQALGATLSSQHGVDVSELVGADLAPDAEALRAALSAASRRGEPLSVLLHYVGYGYAAAGDPRWLVAGLEDWRSHESRGRLVTLFHEVFASGPPWSRSFWSAPTQKALARRLATLSDGRATTLHLYRGLLDSLAPGHPTAVVPMASSLGEPELLPSWEQREAFLIVLGGAGNRERVYREQRALATACAALGLETIADVGPSVPEEVTARSPVPVERLGILPAAEISARLLRARAGALAYQPAFLPKSTVFAAYCAHGVIPVCLHPPAPVPADLDAAPWWPDSGAADPGQVSREAHAWYQDHSLRQQAMRYHQVLFEPAL